VAVEDDADATPAASVLVALPPRQHRLTVEALDAKSVVSSPLRTGLG
jgi:hypothetical protein